MSVQHPVRTHAGQDTQQPEVTHISASCLFPILTPVLSWSLCHFQRPNCVSEI